MNFRLFDLGCPLYWQANLSALIAKLLNDHGVQAGLHLLCQVQGLSMLWAFSGPTFGFDVLKPLRNVGLGHSLSRVLLENPGRKLMRGIQSLIHKLLRRIG